MLAADLCIGEKFSLKMMSMLPPQRKIENELFFNSPQAPYKACVFHDRLTAESKYLSSD